MRVKKLMIRYFATHTGKSEDQISTDLERDFYMSADEAKVYGLIDDILIRGNNGKNVQK